jgi:hypothetical protein
MGGASAAPIVVCKIEQTDDPDGRNMEPMRLRFRLARLCGVGIVRALVWSVF